MESFRAGDGYVERICGIQELACVEIKRQVLFSSVYASFDVIY